MSTKKPLNVGVIGVNLGKGHCEAYNQNPDAKLLAICDSDKEWLDYCKEKYNVPIIYTDYKELLANPDIDAVSICLPTSLHKEATIAAFERGKHVLCEKPMALNVAVAEAMNDAAIKAGKKLMISQNQRFAEDAVYLKRLVENGTFGDIYFIRTGWRRPMGMMPGPLGKRENGAAINRNWFNEKNNGGGVLRDLGSHLIDLAMFLTGFPEHESASCSCYRKFFPDNYEEYKDKYTIDSEDLAAGHLKFKNGMSMQLEVSFGSQVESEVIFTEIYGTKAGASRRNGRIKIFRCEDNVATVEEIRGMKIPIKKSMDWFIESIINDTEVPVTGAQGIEIIKILDAVYASGGLS